MALYEIVFIARQDLSAEDVDNLSEKFSKIISDNKGKVVSKEYWGLRNLAYKINKNPRGHYVLLNVDSEYPAIAEVKRVMGFNEDLVRSSIYNVAEHQKQSVLMVSIDAKSHKEGKTVIHAPSEIDSEVDQIVINNLL
ncbi:MAG: rpsF [Rickettsiaceae bacterium]|jgi:small subunit ribosomal protein S6|nr:rpsF [Rickettsiaceae bacterium]